MVKLFQLRRKSLFGQILDWMLTPLLLLLPLSVMLSWVVAESIAGRPFDRGLEHNVKALVQLVKTDQHHILFNLPSPAREILRADDADTIYYQVIGTQSELISGDRDFPLPPEDEKITPGEMHLRDDKLQGTNIRVAYVWVKTDLPHAKPVLVQVGETLEKREIGRAHV